MFLRPTQAKTLMLSQALKLFKSQEGQQYYLLLTNVTITFWIIYIMFRFFSCFFF